MIKILYYIYQIVFCVPVIVISLIICTAFIVLGTKFGNANYWAYHPGRIWSKIIVKSLFLPIKVEGNPLAKTFNVEITFSFATIPFKVATVYVQPYSLLI